MNTIYNPGPIWAGETVVIIASGPSLTQEQIDLVKQYPVRVVTINDAVFLHRSPDIAYACDAKWWRFHQGLDWFNGQKISLEETEFPNVSRVLNGGDQPGLAEAPYVYEGRNSSYQATNLVVNLGVSKILYIGLDMKLGAKGKKHFFGDHPPEVFKANHKLPLDNFIRCFNTLTGPLQEKGIEVFNCSLDTALECFPRKDLKEALDG